MRRGRGMRIAGEPSVENAPGTHRNLDRPLFEPPAMAVVALVVAALGEGTTWVETLARLAGIAVAYVAVDLWHRAHTPTIVPEDLASRAAGPAVGCGA